MATALAIVGPVAVALTWLVVRSARLSIWTANTIVVGALGALSFVAGDIRWGGDGTTSAAITWLGIGLAAGVLLYAATRAFMAVAGRWPPLARQTDAIYGNRGSISLPAALLTSGLVVAPGEEVLWRGVVLGVLADGAWSIELAGMATWAAYMVANLFSSSLPIVLGAVVGGAVWTLLAVLSAGVAASIACHVVWTSLMIVRPPVRNAG
jgi:membrane protease YdiL (CAAX protease family)